jgi:PAS domain S-box-containing protein
MSEDKTTQQQQLIDELQSQLREAVDTLDAIRNGEVDALVVDVIGEPQIFTLENADRPYRFLIEQMKEGAMTLSDDGVILYGNARLANLFGASLGKIIGTNLKSYFKESDVSRLENLLSINGPSSRGEFEIVRQDGTSIPIYFSANEVVTDTSDIRLLGAILTDLSEQRRYEERLRQTQKMEAVGQLTGGLAHDFNNLLQAICGNLNLIKLKSDDPERISKWAENGLQAAERGAKLTSQLLAFSRLQQIEIKPVDTDELMSGIKDLLKHSLGPSVDIRYELTANENPVYGDQTQLELAILNLAINARDAMPQGGKLTLSTANRFIDNDTDLPAGHYFELSVTDNGTGMSEEVLNRAFEPFFTTKGVGQGTGLGLAQVYGIAQQAGGFARIRSILGSGTTVTLFLRQADTMDARASELQEMPLDPTSKRQIKIFVIDDDDDVRNSLVEVLMILGYSVSDAADGMTGIEMMLKDSPDVLLIDYAMPVHNGAEIVKLAREKGLLMPVIFASGYSDKSALNEAVGVQANLLLKPFTIAALNAELEKVLNEFELYNF